MSKRILIYANEKTDNGNKSACISVIETEKISVNGIHIEFGDIEHDFTFEDLIELGEIRKKFNSPLWSRIKSLTLFDHDY